MRFSVIRFASYRRGVSFGNKHQHKVDRRFAQSQQSHLKSFNQTDDQEVSPEEVISFTDEFDDSRKDSRFQPRLHREERDKSNPDETSKSKFYSKAEKVPLPYAVTAENRFQLLNQILAPLHLLTYENQLRAKHGALSNLMQKYGYLLKKAKSPVIIDDNGLPCPLHFPVESPRTTEYRNKDEFSIWPGFDGNRKTVGFLLGEPKKHTNAVCVEPDQVPISKKNHRTLAALFQQYLREHSPYDVNTDLQGSGNWRRFGVRSNEAGEHMIYCQMNPQNLSREQLDEEKDRLCDFFKGSIESDFNIKSAFFQPQSGVRQPGSEAPYELLFGSETIKETIMGRKFNISPESFMQVNIAATEKLYEVVLNQLELTPDSVLIDCCSGVGVLSVLASKRCRRVIAIEQSIQATEDAKLNAQLNGVSNVHFINGPVEKELPKLTDEFYGQKVVIALNPGRGGLHHSVMTSIRSFDPVSRVVYISCKPAGVSLKNFVHLAMKPTNRDPGLSLLPIEATPVDLFPSTDHCELVLTFERFL